MLNTRLRRLRFRLALQTTAVVIGSSLAFLAFLNELGGSLAASL